MHTKTTMTESELKDYLREHIGVETVKAIGEASQTDLAKVGIIALVDEATRYQETRPNDELQTILKKRRGRPPGSKNKPKT